MSVLGFQELDEAKVGGKGANLAALSRVEGVRVPAGFCISTDAYRRLVGTSIDDLLDRAQTAEVSAEIRRVIEGIVLPEDLVARVEEGVAYAVRSSATAEDLPTASFAGQQDTFLNVIGRAAILDHIGKCWASLFTERAVAYRVQNGFDHRQVHMAVVVQEMVFPQAAGVLFTADPVTSNRKVIAIEANFGLGEALVSGRVNADSYKVRDGEVVEKTVATKKLATYALADGGTEEWEIAAERQGLAALTDEQILELARLGRQIEAHFGQPQDIEWCLADGLFYIVQSRPITTLFPIPVAADRENHVYLSVGHQQMMTDPLKPLGRSMWQLKAGRPMFEAGGRLFVDVTAELASTGGRQFLSGGMGQHDPLTGDALRTIIERDFVKLVPGEAPVHKLMQPPVPIENDPAIVAGLIARNQASVDALRQAIGMKPGPALFDFVREDHQEQKQLMADPLSARVYMAAINASAWINEHMLEWLGEKNVADTLSQSVPNNVTSEMGLALLDVADTIRPYPAVIDYLQRGELDFPDGLDGGVEARNAISAFLDKYGIRGAGEIDITRPRWAEQPAVLIPMILGNIKNCEPGASQRKFEQGRQQAQDKEQELLERLKQLPDGEQKASETKAKIDLLRTFIGYREYPKYGIVNRMFVHKQALMQEADRLVRANVLREREDCFYLTFDEFHEVSRSNQVDDQLIARRKAEHQAYEKLTPPRVLTSEGEVVAGRYKRENVPPGALVGLAVSSGLVEGRARVIARMEDATLEEGDILVTAFTDPSWTTLFVSIKGMVTEVGGLMTHGAVIAREFGLPAVVGVEKASKLFKDWQRFRVHGTEGYVELL
ncbi:MAG: Pyruvate, water dikinase [Cyanobacteria bacterium RYN_339]|nr:Pyruvate, water dikinase [Cyanobacteria bacterium RYN_339]